MIIVKKSTLTYFLLIFLFGISFLLTLLLREPRIKLGQHYIYCNPKAKIDLQNTYHLNLWDYNWPIKESGTEYRAYLLQAIRDFQKIYPNVRVELKLLDFLTGPAQLKQALRLNNAPDIYCSAYRLPEFNFKRQIPVGPYLKKDEQEIYFPNIKKMLTYDGTLCYFPRWVAPEFWIANQALMESAGLSAVKIQNAGWRWQDLIESRKRIPGDKYLLVGNLGANGFYKQLIDTANQELQTVNDETASGLSVTVDFMETLIRQKALPTDCDRNMLSRFLNGQAMLLAGLRPAIYDFINRKPRKEPVDWHPVFVPIPVHLAGKGKLSVENGVIAIYRNKRTAGDDHLTAAMKFAQFLSCYQNITPWKHLMLCPAAKSVYSTWIEHMPQSRLLYNSLTKHPLINKAALSSQDQAKIYSILNDFIAQKITATEAKTRLK